MITFLAVKKVENKTVHKCRPRMMLVHDIETSGPVTKDNHPFL